MYYSTVCVCVLFNNICRCVTSSQCGHGFALNENGRCTGELSLISITLSTVQSQFEKQCLSPPPWPSPSASPDSSSRPIPQIRMSVPSSPLFAPLTVLSAPTPTAAISAEPGRDATRALNPATMGRPVWVSGSGWFQALWRDVVMS